MTKKKIVLIMSLCMLMLIGGCSKKGASKKDYVLKDHVTLGQYKGIEVTAPQVLAVEDEDIDEAINQELILSSASEEEVEDDRTIVENDDIITMDYKGLLDGEAFEGGTAEGAELQIGSGRFIPGFEEQLIGAKVGEQVELNLTFPEDYEQNEALAGQDVVFEVTVTSIDSHIVYPELTDELVKENTDFDTIADFRESVRQILEEKNIETAENIKTNDIFSKIIENSEIKSYPQSLIDNYIENMNAFYSQYATMYGMELEDFIGQFLSSTMEEYNAQATILAEDAVGQQLIIESIVEAEKIKISDSEYDEGVEKILAEYEFETKEDLFEQISEDEIIDSLLWQKAVDFVMDNSKEI